MSNSDITFNWYLAGYKRMRGRAERQFHRLSWSCFMSEDWVLSLAPHILLSTSGTESRVDFQD